MPEFAQNILDRLIVELEGIQASISDPITYSEAAVNRVAAALEELKLHTLEYHFQSKSEEINFFKNIKPQFVCKLIYYHEIYTIEIHKPYGSRKSYRKFYNMQLSKLQEHFDNHMEFYRYYRTGNISLDKKYFLRRKHDLKLGLECFYFQTDDRFSTSHDFLVARILANEMLYKYINNCLTNLDKWKVEPSDVKSAARQKWTGSKVALVELIYALHSEGIFNEGSSDLKDIAVYFEQVFNIDLGQFHRVFLEIRGRKIERTKFLNGLREKLVRRMDGADEV